MVLLTGSDAYVQLITVLVVFVLVLAVTALTTKWIANYQKKQGINRNIEVIETSKLGSNKWIQIVRVGESYKVIAVCKDTVTMLGEVSAEQLNIQEGKNMSLSFKELLDKAVKKAPDEADIHKETDTHEKS
ncbi:MAG: flagellar biosynthetic protein FliO [Lachnospiraceae bacterium]|nr:flagellar biosynthetic protein FliO [Lachnospiraceae bacterium]